MGVVPADMLPNTTAEYLVVQTYVKVENYCRLTNLDRKKRGEMGEKEKKNKGKQGEEEEEEKVTRRKENVHSSTLHAQFSILNFLAAVNGLSLGAFKTCVIINGSIQI